MDETYIYQKWQMINPDTAYFDKVFTVNNQLSQHTSPQASKQTKNQHNKSVLVSEKTRKLLKLNESFLALHWEIIVNSLLHFSVYFTEYIPAVYIVRLQRMYNYVSLFAFSITPFKHSYYIVLIVFRKHIIILTWSLSSWAPVWFDWYACVWNAAEVSICSLK